MSPLDEALAALDAAEKEHTAAVAAYLAAEAAHDGSETSGRILLAARDRAFLAVTASRNAYKHHLVSKHRAALRDAEAVS